MSKIEPLRYLYRHHSILIHNATIILDTPRRNGVDAIESIPVYTADALASLQAENNRLREELAAARHALIELRLRLHAQGRRPEECYEMSLIDAAMQQERRDE